MLTFSSFRARLTASIFLFLSIAAINLQAQRLPTTIVPSHYNLVLGPDIAGQKFTGEETITVQVQQATSEIVLNSLGLDISLAEATAANKTLPAKVTYDQPNEMVRLAFATSMPKGIVALRLKFSGKLTAGLRGLYLSKSARRQYAVTQFEGTS
jgi:aminopeptidase N